MKHRSYLQNHCPKGACEFSLISPLHPRSVCLVCSHLLGSVFQVIKPEHSDYSYSDISEIYLGGNLLKMLFALLRTHF